MPKFFIVMCIYVRFATITVLQGIICLVYKMTGSHCNFAVRLATTSERRVSIIL